MARPALLLGSAFLAAVLLRLGAWAVAAVIPRDGITFVALATAWREGAWRTVFEHHQHPLFPIFAGTLAALTDCPEECAASCLSLLAGALTLLPLWQLTRRLAGPEAAGHVAWLYAALPPLVAVASRPLSDALYLFFFLAGVAVVPALVAGRSRAPAPAAGFLGGLAYLTRPEGLALPLVAAAFLSARRRLRDLGLLLIAFLLAAGPYAGWLSYRAGTLRVTAKKEVTVLAGIRPEHPVQPLSDEGLAGRPVATLAELCRHLAEASGWVCLPLALLALRAGPPRRAAVWFLLALGALQAAVLFRLGLSYGYLARRHLLGPALLLLPAAAAGLRVLPRRAAAAFLALYVAFGAFQALRPRDRAHLPLKRLGLWLAARAGPGALLVPLGYPRVAYYARARILAPLDRHQDLLSPDPRRRASARARFRRLLPKGKTVWVVLSSRQPSLLRDWLRPHLIEIHRERNEKGDWWCLARFSSSRS